MNMKQKSNYLSIIHKIVFSAESGYYLYPVGFWCQRTRMGRWFHTGVCSVGNMYRGRVPPCQSSAGVGHCSPHPTRSLSWAFWAPRSTGYSLGDVEPVSFYKTPRDFNIVQNLQMSLNTCLCHCNIYTVHT